MVTKMLRELILCSQGKIPADIVIKNVRIINVFSKTIFDGDIAIKGKYIARVGNCDDIIGDLTKVFDGKGMYAAPGFIDAHVHVESSLLCPTQFARAIIPHGTAAIITDFHELGNVLGVRGLHLMLDEARKLPVKIFVMAPSCVPAAPNIDTSGAEIRPEDIAELLKDDMVLGLGELMNFPGVLDVNENVLQKIALAEKAKKIIDGHAPLLSGSTLQAYISAGILTDHESTTEHEAVEKLHLGMYLLVRQGTVARDIGVLKRVISEKLPLDRCILVTDDKHVDDILENGHLEPVLRTAIELGVDPIEAIRMVTLNVSTAYGLRRLGALSPGYYADVVLFENLEDVHVKAVFLNGELVARDGKLLINLEQYKYPDWALKTMRLAKEVSEDELTIRACADKVKIRLIVAREGSVVTDCHIEEVETKNCIIEPDPERDILEIVVAERHKATGNIGKGFVRGFGLKRGAIGSSVAHDSHNIIAVGANRRDLAEAINAVAKIQGGLVVVDNGKVRAKLELPLAGLMSLEEPHRVSERLKKVIQAAKDLGAELENPFMVLSFMALPVIPKLKITDKGLFDVDRFSYVPLIV